MRGQTIVSRTANDLWRYRTVEWSAKVAPIHEQLQVTHYVLPNLPNVISQQQEQNYYDVTRSSMRIQTIAACWHDHNSLLEYVEQAQGKCDKLLIVGGNGKGDSTMSSLEAAKVIKDSTNEIDVWGVANPNDSLSMMRVSEKIEAGIQGIVTQPLLSSHALKTLESYPRNSETIYIAGLALPTTSNSLLFWLELLGQPDLINDSVFRDHLDYFASGMCSLKWAEQELISLEKASIDGIHYMPMSNTNDLLSLLTYQN
jgi:hypothetical protein